MKTGLLFENGDINIEALNDALFYDEIIMIPDTCVGTLLVDYARVTEIKSISRRRKDNIQRYHVHCTEIHTEDDYYCGHINTMRARDVKSEPLTAKEIADTYYIYPKQRIRL